MLTFDKIRVKTLYMLGFGMKLIDTACDLNAAHDDFALRYRWPQLALI